MFQVTRWRLMLFCCSHSILAFASSNQTLGSIASNILQSFTNIGLMITGASYIGGLAFAIGAIMKFKQHKDNPSQVTLGVPLSLLFVASALFFLPSLIMTTGNTIFSNPVTAGPLGTTIGST